MTIQAKFPGRCATCGATFAAGTSINWQRGQQTSHAACPTTSRARPAWRSTFGRSDSGLDRFGRIDGNFDDGTRN